jgi:hypothetical protein
MTNTKNTYILMKGQDDIDNKNTQENKDIREMIFFCQKV